MTPNATDDGQSSWLYAYAADVTPSSHGNGAIPPAPADHVPGYTQTMFALRHLALPILICGIIANFISCIVFSQARIWRHYLSVYLRALSLNDMFLLVSYAVASRTDLHIRSQAGCFASVFAYGLFSTLSPWLLVCISLDRALVCVSMDRGGCGGGGGDGRRTNAVFRRASPAIFLLAALCLLANCHVFYTTVYTADPAFSAANSSTSAADHPAAVVMNCKPRPGTEFVFIADGLATAVVPGLALSLLNGFICCRIRSTYRRLSSSLATTTTTAAAVTKTTRSCRGSPPRAAGNAYMYSQVTRMLLGFSIAYLVLNLPNCAAFLASLCLWNNSAHASPAASASDGRLFEAINLARQLGQTLYFVHFSINSAVCACANRKYRAALIHVLGRLFSCCPRARPSRANSAVDGRDGAAAVVLQARRSRTCRNCPHCGKAR